MDDHRFDDITRALASRRPRRRVLGALGGAIAALGFGSVAAQGSGNGNGNGNGNSGDGNGNGNGNWNYGDYNGNWNGNWNNGGDNGNRNGNWNNGSWSGNGNGNGNGWCDLTTADCPGGVNAESCSCIPVACENATDPCGPNCSCAELIGSDALVCVDHGGACGYRCGPGSDYENNCPSGMICADAYDCGDYYCYPMCGDSASCAMVPDILV